jgi:fermentation-respiration switch protein FrsA (DUF1100 family)
VKIPSRFPCFVGAPLTKRIFSIFLSLVLLQGCNHLFYFPDRVEYITPEKVELKYEDYYFNVGEEKLHMWKIPAASSESLGKVLHFHGNAQNISTHFLFSAWMARFGFDVYVFDYRGYGKSTGKPGRKGLVEDGIAAIKYVDGLDQKDFYILAQSLGGAVAVPSIALSGVMSKIRAVTLDSTFGSYRMMARDKLANLWLTWPFQWPLSFLVSDDFSPDDYVSSLQMPVLFVHGTSDNVVPYSMGQELFKRLISDKKEFWTLEDAPHTWFLSEESDWHIRYLEYLCKQHRDPKSCAQDLVSVRKKVDAQLYLEEDSE